MRTTNQQQYIEVGIGDERYAIKIDEIHEIIRMQEITAIPRDKEYLLGVINLRGKIIPVISLRSRFGLPAEDYSKSTRIVVINYHGEMVGLVVDRVIKVATYNHILPPPERLGSEQSTYIEGIEGDRGDLVSILDIERLLQD